MTRIQGSFTFPTTSALLPASSKWLPFMQQLCLDRDVAADHRSLQQFADAAAVVEQAFFDASQHEPDETQTAMVVEYFLLTCLSARPAEAL